MFALTTRNPRAAVRRLAFSRLISLTGTGAAMIALAFFVYQKTGSTLWVSAAMLATFSAAGLAAPLGGALGDRFDRRRVLIVADLLGAVTFAVLAFIHQPAWMIAAAFVAEAVASPTFPAVEAAVPNLAGPEHLSWANGTIGFGRNVGLVVGPAIGGVLAGTMGAGFVFWLNAASFLLSAVLVWSVRGRFSEERTGPSEHHGLRAGFVFVAHDRLLRAVTLTWMVLLFGVGTVIVAELPLSRSFGLGSTGYGLLAAFWGVGAVIGSLAGKRLRREQEPAGLFLGTVGPALGFGLIAFLPWFAPVLLSLAFAGGTDGVSTVAFQNMTQRRTPDEVRSRVMAAMDAAVTTALALSFVFAGPFVAAVGPRGAYLAAGVSCLLGAAILLPPLLRDQRLEPANDEIEASVAAA
ncbi:MAG TPA: MFS transporter [Actinomycetota bacterium]|nr:MFS transporter [Actinomycetota bacterium]